MGDKSTIEWTDASWNPVTGCSKVSPGCAHCYAETLTLRHAKRWGVPDLPWTPQNAEQNVILHPERLDQPLRWKRTRMIFVNSMSDLFHELVPFDYIDRVFAVMALADHHVFQVLTKRPERMREYMFYNHNGSLAGGTLERVAAIAEEIARERGEKIDEWWDLWLETWPLRHIWLGTSIESRRFVSRADELRATPAAVRFISAEPLLGPLVTNHYIGAGRPVWNDGYVGPDLDLRGIDWLIVGGESGPGHRPMRIEWVRALRHAARGVDTAFFFKQWGGRTPKAGGRELDGRTWDEMPGTPREQQVRRIAAEVG